MENEKLIQQALDLIPENYKIEVDSDKSKLETIVKYLKVKNFERKNNFYKYRFD